ncbi:pyridine nucleotide/NAD(P) transhydrogenase alpha plus beta subunit [Cryptosporidium ryanae]|uniref:pyridine nucleotide/NAD(P) transhydrogenase alpha plus beta subunit n=1 Tax=Cryptosporidium ryanae TaxID=515981 RepID=UPI003519FB50|nr:pyridine nucleotide/NAD(P) transhydrogenase alpha plus beta subunit [Cryptosporidium ryanae]
MNGRNIGVCLIIFSISLLSCILENSVVFGELNLEKEQFTTKGAFRGKSGLVGINNELKKNTLFFGSEDYYKENDTNLNPIVTSGYLFSALCFIYSIKGLSSQNSGYKSNVAGFIGMTVGIIVTMTEEGFGNHYIIFLLTILISGGIGVYIAKKTELIRMPQLVAVFHSLICLSAILVSYSFFYTSLEGNELVETSSLRRIEIFFGGVIGMVTFMGSVIAAMKLDDIIPSKSANIPYKNLCLIMILSSMFITGVGFCSTNNQIITLTNLHCGMIFSAMFGIFMTVSIGGADMPVVISMLNSYSGWSTAITGFLLDNTLLIVSGALIGSSGAILSYIMCNGMNRNFVSVILGGFEQIEDYSATETIEDRRCYKATVNETANLLLDSSKILIVPGYGMAVSKAHECISEIVKELESRGCEVDICIHPVAGRMPGHMNVLLAEVDVPTRNIKEMAQVNDNMEEYDLVLVVGANDIVNPAALVKESKIFGMPVICVWRARQVIVSKRTLGHGYACINNELFTKLNTKMLLGDSKKTLNSVKKILRCSNLNNNFTLSNDPEFLSSSRKVSEEYDDIADETSPLITILNEQKERMEEREQDESKIYTIDIKKRIAILPGLYEEGKSENIVIFPIPPSEIFRFRRKGYGVGLSKECINTQNNYFTQEEYVKGGAFVYESTQEMMKESDIVIKLGKPTVKEADSLRKGQVLICNMCILGQNYNIDKENKKDKLLKTLSNKGITVIDLDQIPRTSNAQTMDVRTTISNISGYRAVVEAMNYLPRISRSISSAAGTIQQSTVLVIGVGVAGLQAIATARSMGTKVIAMDTRLASKEESESCGAKFVKLPEADLTSNISDKNGVLDEQRKVIGKYLKNADIVITSANEYGTVSPVLITDKAIREMKQGSVIVDLSADFGGNCELTERNKVITEKESGVTIVGKSNFLFSMPLQSSELFSGNIYSLIIEMGKTADQFRCDLENDIIRKTCIINDGKVLNKFFSDQDKQSKKLVEDKTLTEKQYATINTTTTTTTTTTTSTTSTTASNTVSSSLISIQNYFNSEDEACDEHEDSKTRGTKERLIKNFKKFTKTCIIPNSYFLLSMTISIIMFIIMGINMSIIQIYNIFSFIMSIIIGYYCVWEVDSKLHTPLMSITNALSGVIIIGSMMQYGTQTVNTNTLMALSATFLSSINTFGGFYVTNRMLTLFE